MPTANSIPEGLISETKSFDIQTPITKVIPAILRYGAVIINRGDEYMGIIDSRTMYKYLPSFTLPKKETAGKFAVRVPRITDSTSIDDVIYYFHKARTKSLPYVKGNKIKGVLKRQTLIKMLLSLNRLSGLKVSDAMVAPLIGVDSAATLTQAKAAMRGNNVSRLAVLEGDKFVGIVTNYDLMDKYAKPIERLPNRKSYMYNPANIKIDDAAQKNPVTIDYGSGIREAAQRMVEKQVSSLVVTKAGKPVGMLTELDLITSVVASSKVEESKIFVSGLDESTYEYEDEIRAALKAFVERIEKIHSVEVEYTSMTVKKFKTNSYELYIRISLARQGILNLHTTGHLFERTFYGLLKVGEKEVRKEKDTYLTVRRVSHNAHVEEEAE